MLGISFIVFNRTSLLEKAIRSYLCLNPYINCVFSKKDFLGNEYDNKKELELLMNLKIKGLINEIIITDSYKEIDKRNEGLKDCIHKGCSIYVSLDCDEVASSNINLAYSKFIRGNYDKSYMVLLEKDRVLSYYIPMFHKINSNSKHVYFENNFMNTNPDRELNISNNNFYVHDFSYINHFTEIDKEQKIW